MPLSLRLLSITRGEEKMKKLVDQDKDRGDHSAVTVTGKRDSRQQVVAPQEAEVPLPSCHQAEGGDLRDRGEWKQVPAWGGRQILSRPP